MNKITPAALDMEISSFQGNGTVHGVDMYNALVELRQFRKLMTDPKLVDQDIIVECLND